MRDLGVILGVLAGFGTVGGVAVADPASTSVPAWALAANGLVITVLIGLVAYFAREAKAGMGAEIGRLRDDTKEMVKQLHGRIGGIVTKVDDLAKRLTDLDKLVVRIEERIKKGTSDE